MPTNEYNGFGIRITQPFDKNPIGNQDIVWNSAKRPTQAGSFLPGQAISDLTFLSGYSQRRIRITMNPGDNPVQQAGSIAIINEGGEVVWSAGDAETNAINFISPETDIGGILIVPQVETTAPMLRIDIGFPASSSDAIQINNQGTGKGVVIETTSGRGVDVTTTDTGFPIVVNNIDAAISPFKRVMLMGGGAGPAIIESDGTDPNGTIAGPIGSLCLNASVTGQLAYNADGSTTWVTL